MSFTLKRKNFFFFYFKRKKILTHAIAWVCLEDIILSEINQSQMTYCIFCFN